MSERTFENYVTKQLESGNYSVDDARRIMTNYDMQNGTNYLGGTPILSKSNSDWNGSSPSNVSWSSSNSKNKNKK